MSRRRRGSLADFADGFSSTFNAFQNVQKTIKENDLRDELKNAQENGGQTSTNAVSGEDALTAGQGALDQALQNATTDEERAQIQQNFEPTITALSQPELRSKPASVISSIGTGTGFKQQTDKPFTKEDVNLNNMAMREGIYRKYGQDDKADQLQSQAQNRQLAGIQIDRAKRENEYEAGKQAAWANTDMGRAYAEHAKQQEAYQANPNGAAPPVKPAFTAGQSISSALSMFNFDAAHGKSDPNAIISMNDRIQKLEEEGYTKAMRDLHNGVSVDKVLEDFNKSGKEKLTKDQIVGAPVPVEVDLGNGQKMKTFQMSIKDKDGNVRTFNGLRELQSLGAASQEVKQHLDTLGAKNDTTKAGAAATSAGASMKQATVSESKENRASDKEDKLTKAATDLQAAQDSSDPKAIAKARIAFVAAGGKLEKPEGVKADFTPNPMGMGGTVKQISPDGSVTVTPVGSSTNGTVRVGSPGSTGPKVGTEQVIQSGPNKGKTAIWDGNGWRLK